MYLYSQNNFDLEFLNLTCTNIESVNLLVLIGSKNLYWLKILFEIDLFRIALNMHVLLYTKGVARGWTQGARPPSPIEMLFQIFRLNFRSKMSYFSNKFSKIALKPE